MAFKNIRIKKRGGGYRTQRVQVLASGKYKFVKNRGSKASKTRKTSKRKNNPKRRNRMARKKKSRRKRSFTIPVALTVGAVYGMVVPPKEGGDSVLDLFMKGKFSTGIRMIGKHYLGIGPDRQFNVKHLGQGLVPLLIGIVVHKVASKLGINRKLGAAGVPVIRI